MFPCVKSTHMKAVFNMSDYFNIGHTTIKGLTILQRKALYDKRGYLERFFCQQELGMILKGREIVQVNHTLTSTKGAVRGMHFQHQPNAEMKFVSCIRGKVFDVAVDLRKNSSTFLQYHSEVLTAKNHKTFVIPEGFAHGFQALTTDCEMLYFHTANYNKDSEGLINAIDPRLNIKWPKTVVDRSERDKNHPMVTDKFDGISI